MMIIALGVMSNSSTSFLDIMKDLGFDDNTRSFIVRRLMAISIRATYYIFCRRNKEWPNPEHLTLKLFFYTIAYVILTVMKASQL